MSGERRRSARGCAAATGGRARGPEPRREPHGAARDEIAALLRGVSPAALGGEARGARRRRHRAAGRGQVDAAVRARARVAGARAQRRGARGRPVLAALGRLAARRPRADRLRPRRRGVFIRSTAAGERLGGLAPATRAAAHALAAAFDVVVIETVGVGQSRDRGRRGRRHRRGRRPARLRRRPAVPEGGDHGDPRRARRDEGRPGRGRAARAARPERRAALAGRARRRGRRRLLRPARRAASTSWSPRSTPTATRLDLPARRLARAPRRARWPTSPPSTASAGCARSAAGAPRAARWPRAGPGRRRAGARRRARGARRACVSAGSSSSLMLGALRGRDARRRAARRGEPRHGDDLRPDRVRRGPHLTIPRVVARSRAPGRPPLSVLNWAAVPGAGSKTAAASPCSGPPGSDGRRPWHSRRGRRQLRANTPRRLRRSSAP